MNISEVQEHGTPRRSGTNSDGFGNAISGRLAQQNRRLTPAARQMRSPIGQQNEQNCRDDQ
ncbi:MAG: hypothetical protein ACRCUY_10095 [Thermoguttaceae bacterium]